jgi:ribosomal protein L11 methyltransferase
LIRVAVTASAEAAEELRARFVELAPEGFEETETPGGIELAAYGPTAERVRDAVPDAVVTVVEDGWEERWREFHRPAVIGSLWIGPPWLEAPAGLTPIVVDPGQAFGTGAHPTTQLCLELLLEQEPCSVLDVGCGSGVLSLAAGKLGFGPLMAVDIAEAAVEATRANAAVNGVTLDAAVVDALVEELPEASLAFANILLPAVEVLAGRLRVERLIASGYLPGDRPALSGFRHIERRERDGWAADLLIRS